jgi:protein phosphatase
MVEGKLKPPMTGIGTATSAAVGLGHGGKTATRSQTPTRGRPVNWDDVIVEAPATDTGMRRSNNQDSYAVVKAARREVWESKGHLFMVADGMGAHAVGELASKMACDHVPHHYTKSKVTAPAEALTKAYREVGGLIHGKSSLNKDFEGMGTTCSTLVLLPAGSLIAHVGDSRVYRIRQGRIEQLTFDHSLVWELIKRKHLTPEQAERFVHKNVITRSLGPDPNVEVDIEGPYPVELGDVFLLCSDGLSNPVLNDELGAFASNFHPNDASQYLLHLANLRGGNDNITIVLVRVGPWVEPGTEPVEAPQASSRKEGKGLLTSLLGSLKGKPTQSTVEEHVYAEADCAITPAMIEKLQKDIRTVKDIAIENSWPVDWPKLALHVRNADTFKAQEQYRDALKLLGEAITMLGIGGRLHKKNHNKAEDNGR